VSKVTFLNFEQPIAELDSKIEELRFVQDDSAVDISEEIERLSRKSQQLTKDIYAKLTPWQVSQIARHPQRPYTMDYVNEIFTDFHELHGDRSYADDLSIVGGLARFNGQACMVIGHQKGRDTKERALRNFGMPKPEGYRKAMRLMKLAEKFNLPIFTFVDTPGAFPGIDAEERGQSEAIGHNLYVMAELKVPLIATIIGEGGSGGALAIAVGDCRADAAIRHLFGDFAGRLRLHPLENLGARVRCGRSAGPDRAPPQGHESDRQDRHRAARRCPSRPEADGLVAQARAGRQPAPVPRA
jgi:acetyl-CoA carboxylase carboxyl transferase subunit alpha